MANTTYLTYYQRNKDLVLSKAKEYYKNKGRLSKQAQGKHNNLPEERKDKKREYGRNKYAVSEEERIKRNEYDRISYCNQKVIKGALITFLLKFCK